MPCSEIHSDSHAADEYGFCFVKSACDLI